MQEHDLVTQIAELAARLKRIERWQDQWRTRNRKVADLQAEEVLASAGYLVAAGRGLCANRHERHSPSRRTYPLGRTVLKTIEPNVEYHSLLPLYWRLPVKKRTLESGIRFIFSDGSIIARRHRGTRLGIQETHPKDVRFNKDGLTCVKVEFIVNNVGAANVRESLGIFRFEGWQF